MFSTAETNCIICPVTRPRQALSLSSVKTLHWLNFSSASWVIFLRTSGLSLRALEVLRRALILASNAAESGYEAQYPREEVSSSLLPLLLLPFWLLLLLYDPGPCWPRCPWWLRWLCLWNISPRLSAVSPLTSVGVRLPFTEFPPLLRGDASHSLELSYDGLLLLLLLLVLKY